MVKMAQPPPKTKDAFTSWKQVLPAWGLIPVLGYMGEGKSALMWDIAESVHERRPIVALGFPRKLRRLLPKWVKHADSVEDLKKYRGALVVADEMALKAHARDHSTDENKRWAKLAAIVRQYGHLILFCYQDSRQMELSLIMAAQMVIFKRPSVLQLRFCRPELRQEYQEALERFAPYNGQSKKWAYVKDWHHGKQGFLRCHLPSFWSEDISTAYALAALEETEGGQNGRKHRNPNNGLKAL